MGTLYVQYDVLPYRHCYTGQSSPALEQANTRLHDEGKSSISSPQAVFQPQNSPREISRIMYCMKNELHGFRLLFCSRWTYSVVWYRGFCIGRLAGAEIDHHMLP